MKDVPSQRRQRPWHRVIGMNSFEEQCHKWDSAFRDFIYHPGDRFDPSSEMVNVRIVTSLIESYNS